MHISISIIGKSGVGKRSLIELINQQISIELVKDKADIGLLMFDITDSSSYDYIRNRYNLENKINFLVANKIDLEDKRTVQSEIAAKFASRLNMSYHEISCITKQNVSHLLYTMSSNQSSSNRSQTFSQRQQQPTISVLKFNQLSLKNASYSQTESEQKESSESRVSNLPSRQNDPNRSKSQTAAIFSNQEEQIPIQKIRTQELDSNRSQEIQQHIQEFYLSTNQPIKEEANSKEQTIINPQGSFSRTEMDMDIDQNKQSQPDRSQDEQNHSQIRQKSFIQYQTTPIQSQIFLLNQIEQGENRERHRTFKQSPKGLPDLGFRRYTTNSFQRSQSKLQSQIFTQRSQVLLDQNDKLKQLLDQMQNGIKELKEFQDQVSYSEIIEQKPKEIVITKVFDSFDPDKLIRQQQHLKKESMNVYEIKQLIKQQQVLTSGTLNNNILRKTNYFQTVTERSENLSEQKNELVLQEQVREQFRTTPVKQLNYRSVTPGKQIIRHIELESPKSEGILNLQYKLKNGKLITIQFRRKDNLIKVAHDIATKYKLDHQVYLQILNSLKQKSNQALEILKSNRNNK